MIISFFEEFPRPRELKKLNEIRWESKIYVAASSIKEFQKIKDKIDKFKNKNILEIVYWPVLKKEEGYWISPWSSKKALKRIFSEIIESSGSAVPAVMLDLEPPKERWQLLTKAYNYVSNKRNIKKFLRKARKKGIKIYLVEIAHLPVWLIRLAGLSYSAKRYGLQKIMMYYTSFGRKAFPDEITDERFAKMAKKTAEEGNLLGIGCISTGILGWEPINSPEIVGKELEMAKKAGVKETVIFRLGGLDQSYARAILKVMRHC